MEYAPKEMAKNGADYIHLATGLIVGYPPCPFLDYFTELIPTKYNLEVVLGTHPIPQNYYLTHQQLGTWKTEQAQAWIGEVLADESIRRAYD